MVVRSTNKEKILNALSLAELCDDCLSSTTGVRPRQAVNITCRALSNDLLTVRHFGKCNHCHKAKIVNSLSREYSPSDLIATRHVVSGDTKPWYWEGNVQNKVVEFLDRHGFTIRSAANTASKESGKDIVCTTPSGNELWISVKGYPESSANTQARHWFSQAIFDLILYRGEDPNAELALAFPDGFVTYTKLLPRVMWLKQTNPFKVYWVSENGTLRIE